VVESLAELDLHVDVDIVLVELLASRARAYTALFPKSAIQSATWPLQSTKSPTHQFTKSQREKEVDQTGIEPVTS
jgi:hypothetical protein